MLVLPIDTSRPLLVLAPPTPQLKDRANGVVATDRDTGQPLADLSLALPVDGGTPTVLRVTVPQPGIPEGLTMGSQVKATGLLFLTGEKNGRTWQMFRASAITAVKG
jgi:hypothetical protein